MPTFYALSRLRKFCGFTLEQSHAICISRPLNQTRKLNNRYPPNLLSVYKIEDLLEIFLKLYSYYVHNKFDIMIYIQAKYEELNACCNSDKFVVLVRFLIFFLTKLKTFWKILYKFEIKMCAYSPWQNKISMYLVELVVIN